MAKKKLLCKKYLIVSAVSFVLALALVLGLVFGIRCSSKSDKVERVETLLILEQNEKFIIGKPVVYQFYVYSNVDYVNMVCVMNNGSDKSLMGVEHGLAKDHKKYNGENAKYFIDSGTQIIDTTEMKSGYYTLVFYGITDDGTRVRLSSAPVMFELV